VNFGKTYFSESFPELWLFLMGGLFIGVVMASPTAGRLWDSHVKPGGIGRGAVRRQPPVQAAVAPPPTGQAQD
jgi:urea transport system permease protein